MCACVYISIRIYVCVHGKAGTSCFTTRFYIVNWKAFLFFFVVSKITWNPALLSGEHLSSTNTYSLTRSVHFEALKTREFVVFPEFSNLKGKENARGGIYFWAPTSKCSFLSSMGWKWETKLGVEERFQRGIEERIRRHWIGHEKGGWKWWCCGSRSRRQQQQQQRLGWWLHFQTIMSFTYTSTR